MKYSNIHKGIFIERPNRFIAKVRLIDDDGNVSEDIETVHVKNTGSCPGLLMKGNRVLLNMSDNPKRKTRYDLVAVCKDNTKLFNIDSQAPNMVVGEWLHSQNFDLIRPEYTYNRSRIDFYMEKGPQKYLMEVKGCTLVRDGQAYFPDAHSERAIKHLGELKGAKGEGYRAAICFVIQTEGPETVLPEENISPDFARIYHQALAGGVEAIALSCRVTESGLKAIKAVRLTA